MYFAEFIEVHHTDETLQAVCFEYVLCAPAATNLTLKNIFFNDQSVSIFIPAHRYEGVILHYPPKLSWEGQPNKNVVPFYVGSNLVWVL